MPCSSSCDDDRASGNEGRNGEFVKELARRCHGVPRHVRDPRREIVGVLVCVERPRGTPPAPASPCTLSPRSPSIPGSCRCSRWPFPGGCAARAFAMSARSHACPHCRSSGRQGVPAFAGRMSGARPASRHMVRQSSEGRRGVGLPRQRHPRRARPVAAATRGVPAMRPRRGAPPLACANSP